MRSLVAVVVVVLAGLGGTAAAKGKRATVDLDFTQLAIGDAMRLLGDTGKVNVVVLEGADTKVDVKAKNVPWDDVLADVVAKANLAFVREGNVFIVGSQAAIEARKAVKKTKSSGPMIQLDFVGASAKDAAFILSVASNTAFDLDGGDAVTLRLRQVQLSVAKDILALASKATAVPAPTKRTITRTKGACVAPTLPLMDLELFGIVGIGAKRWAILGTRTSAEVFIVAPKDCLGVEGQKIARITPEHLELPGSDSPYGFNSGTILFQLHRGAHAP